MSARAAAVLVALTSLATTGCFATRNDVRVLQDDLALMRSEQARRDSAAARSSQATASDLSARLAVLADSMRVASARVARWEAGVQGDIRSIQEQLLQVQELAGQSQRRLQELRADMETRAQAQPVAPVPTPTVPGDTTARPAPGSPGPNQLYQLATDQYNRGSYATARNGFDDLLKQYPQSDLVPDAMFFVAESYRAEKKNNEADSVYTTVFQKYPRSPRAANALYKHGLALKAAGRDRDARATFDRVVREYPRSDEAELAREQLRAR